MILNSSRSFSALYLPQICTFIQFHSWNMHSYN